MPAPAASKRMKPSEHPLGHTAIHRILLIQLGDIGDVVLSFPCIQALRENFPAARIVVAVREKAGGLLEECPWISESISVGHPPKGILAWFNYQFEFFSRLRRHRFDLAVDLRTGTRGAVMALLSGAPLRISRFAYDGGLWRNRVFTHLAAPDLQPGQAISDYYLKILTESGLHTRHAVPKIAVSSRKLATAGELLRQHGLPRGQPFIVLQPFSLWHYKELPPTTVTALIRAIERDFHLPMVLAGGPEDRSRAEALRHACPEARLVNLAGKTTLSDYAALLKMSGLFIGIDSAGLHLAAAVGVPTVGIFGPSSMDAWAPRGKQHVVVHKDMDCIPCSQKGCNSSGISRCMEELSVGEITTRVWPHIEKFISGLPG